MARKPRPRFSAPSDKAAPGASGSQWVYRTDPSPAIAPTPEPPALPRPTVSAVAPARSAGVVTVAARLLFPVALVTVLVLEPLTARFRRKT